MRNPNLPWPALFEREAGMTYEDPAGFAALMEKLHGKSSEEMAAKKKRKPEDRKTTW